MDAYEPNGIRGINIVVRVNLKAGVSCPDMQLAQESAFEYLVSKLAEQDEPVETHVDWDAIFSDPNKVTIPTLKLAILELSVFGTFH